MQHVPRTGVILANLGSVSSPDPRDVKTFLIHMLTNKRIAPRGNPLWKLLVKYHIAPAKSRVSSEKYKLIWTQNGSPLMDAHACLEKGLEGLLKECGFRNVLVASAMNSSEPWFASAMQEFRRQGCERLLVLPLFPQSAYSSTGGTYDAMQNALSELRWDIPYHLIDNYHDNPTYTKAIAAAIRHAGFTGAINERVLFSFHSIPLSDVEDGDTYELQVGASSLMIAQNLGLEREQWTIGYQSRLKDKQKWLSPYTEDILQRWAEVGVEKVFVVCPGFSVECLETLYDVDHVLASEYRSTFTQMGHPYQGDFRYVPCLGKTRAHLKVLYDVIAPYLEECENDYAR